MRRDSRIGMAALCAAVGLLAGIAAALGVFARGDGTVETVISGRGVTYDAVTTTTMTVQVLNLGLVVPASVFIAVLSRRRNPAGYALAPAYVVTFAHGGRHRRDVAIRLGGER